MTKNMAHQILLYTTVVFSMCFQAHAVHNAYDSDIYNSLEGPELATSHLQCKPNFNSFLKEAFEIIGQTKIPVGLRLLHRHDKVSAVQGMVEVFEDSNPTIGQAAFITNAHTVQLQDNGNFLMDGETPVFPASWVVSTNGALSVFEFSADEGVRRINERLDASASLLDSLTTLILRHDLQSLIAPAVLYRDANARFESKVFLESQHSTLGSVVTASSRKEIADKKAIITSWSSAEDGQTGCISVTHCCGDHEWWDHVVSR